MSTYNRWFYGEIRKSLSGALWLQKKKNNNDNNNNNANDNETA